MLTQIEFPHLYWQLFILNPGIVAEVALRNAVLAAMVVVMLVTAARENRAAGGLEG